ncbi:MAG: hypothetical protein LBE13_05735, partial [Bacteroidales bacterium]|nr:hypothetical protein [Bacteroidales bacterium]
MIDKFKIVCNTAAGRRRYMQYLIPFVVANDIVDRYDLWINTTNMQDIEFFKLLSEKFPKINLVYQPDGIVNGNRSINAFFRKCIEEDVIYFRLDDDIIWMEPDMIEKMVRFRINNPDYFIVSPLVINNAICTYILQNAGKIKLNNYYPARANEDVLWKSGQFSAQLHEWFLTTQLPDKQYKNLYCGKRPIAMNRFSINSILWFGCEMKKFDGIVLDDEEEWLSVIKPTELGAVNCINGDAIVAHFAFYTQRKQLDKLNILNRYGKFLHKEWEQDVLMSGINQTVQAAMHEVEERKVEILAKPNIYP